MSELELEELVETIFLEEPKNKFSIQLQFEESDIKKLFESLLMIVTYGMKIKFSDDSGKVNLSTLTTERLKYFNEYMNSFGMVLLVSVENYNFVKNYESLKYTNQTLTNQTKLVDLRLPMLEDNYVYFISFDYLRDYS
jgi:hypothetical protein